MNKEQREREQLAAIVNKEPSKVQREKVAGTIAAIVGTGRERSFLTGDDAERLASIFNTKEKYIKHMATLNALRAEVLKRCEEGRGPISYNRENPLFRLGELANELIGALGANHKDIIFEDNGTFKEL